MLVHPTVVLSDGRRLEVLDFAREVSSPQEPNEAVEKVVRAISTSGQLWVKVADGNPFWVSINPHATVTVECAPFD